MSTIVIRLAGVDVTDYVVFADAQFTQQTNGQPGGAKIRLRDVGHVLTPHAGQTLTLDIDGDRVWGGWAIGVSPGYFFPVDDTTNYTTTERVWTIEALDYNVLFIKRFLINKADPTKMIPNYPAGTPDSQIVLDIAANFVELSGDGISTAGVTHVGTPNPDKAGNVGNPGTSWGACMSLIARPNQAVFFIDPGKVLRFVDVETATAPFSLSDTPNHSSTFGYRDMEVVKDGTRLINDALVWGAGQGSSSVNFKRVQDASSIAEHGRWQFGEFTTALYTDAGVNHRAQSYVYGSPQSKRGGKDDSIQVSCTIFRPGLIAGQVVNFASHVFGYSDTLPIRRMGIKFPTTTDVEYRLYLSYDIDAPWSDYEFWFPKFNFFIPTFDFNLPPIDILPPPPATSACACGITDDFSGSQALITAQSDVNYGVGNGEYDLPVRAASSGYNWIDSYLLLDTGDTAFSATYVVEGGYQKVQVPSIPQNGYCEVFNEIDLAGASTSTSFGLNVKFKVPALDRTSDGETALSWNIAGTRAAFASFEITAGTFSENNPSSGSPYSQLLLRHRNPAFPFGDTSALAHVAFTPDPSTVYNARFEVETASEMRVKVWADGDTEPTDWTLTADLTTRPSWVIDGFYTFLFAPQFPDASSGATEMWTGELDIDDINACSQVQFESFNRTVALDWGSTDSGAAWSTSSPFASVDGSSGVFSTSSGQIVAEGDVEAPIGDAGGFTLSTKFRFSDVGLTTSAGSNMTMFTDIDSTWKVYYVHYNQTNASVGGIYLQTDSSLTFVSKLDWVANTWYNASIEFVPGSYLRTKIWLEGSAEPSSWVTADTIPSGPSSTTLSVLHVGLSKPSSSFFNIDFIEFDYANKPCFSDCSGSETLDDFTGRTTSLVENSWGTSSSGSVWETSDGTGSCVQDGLGKLFIATGGNPSEQLMTSPPSYLQRGGTFSLSTRFKVDVVSIFGSYVQNEFYMQAWDGGVGVWFVLSNEPGVGGVFLHGNGGGFFFGDFLFTANTWYLARWEQDGATGRAKVWAEGDAEPGWMATGTVTDSRTGDYFRVGYDDGGTPSNNATLSIDYLTFQVCSGAGPVSDPAEPATQGSTCESFSSGASLLVTSAPYQPLTTRVYVGGLLQRINTDYSEQSPTEGKVLLGSPPPSGSTVTVCYIADIAG